MRDLCGDIIYVAFNTFNSSGVTYSYSKLRLKRHSVFIQCFFLLHPLFKIHFLS